MSTDRVAAQAAGALLASAKEHKRAAQAHRRMARRCMKDLAQLRVECAALGIKLEVA